MIDLSNKEDFNLLNKENKINIAWFKLQESYLRNEHERAFIFFRLLSHSFNSDAFRFQALGDLHFIFENFELAEKNYVLGLDLYIFENNIFGIYNILIRLKKIENFELKKSTYEKINKLKNSDKSNKNILKEISFLIS